MISKKRYFTLLLAILLAAPVAGYAQDSNQDFGESLLKKIQKEMAASNNKIMPSLTLYFIKEGGEVIACDVGPRHQLCQTLKDPADMVINDDVKVLPYDGAVEMQTQIDLESEQSFGYYPNPNSLMEGSAGTTISCGSYGGCFEVSTEKDVEVNASDVSRYWSVESIATTVLQVYKDTWMKLQRKIADEARVCRESSGEECSYSFKVLSQNVAISITLPDTVAGSCPADKKGSCNEFSEAFEEEITLQWIREHLPPHLANSDLSQYLSCDFWEGRCKERITFAIDKAGAHCRPDCGLEANITSMDEWCVKVMEGKLHVGCSVTGKACCSDKPSTGLFGVKVKVKGTGTACVECTGTEVLSAQPPDD